MIVKSEENAAQPTSPEMLPPVEPPSAKFIVQLFVVPGLIVAAIVGVWLLFGKLASAEQDWQALVADMKSSNEHRRGRGAMGLAQALAADQNRSGDGPRLATNPQVAQELAKFFADSLKNSSTEPAVIDQQAFLARTLGLLDVPDAILPVLRDAMQPHHDREVRKNAVLAVATIAHRANERGTPLTDTAVVEELSAVSRDPDPLLRSSSAFTLGLVATDTVRQPLTVLLADVDRNTRVNAAIAFARQKALDGLPVLRDILSEAAAGERPGAAEPALENTAPGLDSLLAVSNCLRAVGELASQLDPVTRDAVARDVEAISKNHFDPRVRLDAAQTLAKIRNPLR